MSTSVYLLTAIACGCNPWRVARGVVKVSLQSPQQYVHGAIEYT